MQGDNTTESWSYDAARQAWTPRPDVLFSFSNEALKGSAVAFVGKGIIYALKGNGTAEFRAYQVASRSWTTLDTVPAGPKRKKVKDGAVLAADGSAEVYAFKGNNVSEFYSYNTSLGYWEYRQQLPLAPSNKRLENGSSLVFGAGKVYALKGNSTLEFWVFDPSHGLALNPAGDKRSVQSVATTLPGGSVFELFPNPAVGFASVRGTAPAAGLLRLYDVSGRQVVRQAVNLGSTTRLDLRNLTAGVYLLVLETGNRSQARQLVIEH